jgi:hypothetical protein
MVQTTFGSRDGETTSLDNNGISMVSPRLSRTTNGNLTHLISNPTVDHLTLDVQLPTQDGGNCSDTKTTLLLMKEERLLPLQEELTMRTKTLLLKTRTERHTKDGE